MLLLSGPVHSCKTCHTVGVCCVDVVVILRCLSTSAYGDRFGQSQVTQAEDIRHCLILILCHLQVVFHPQLQAKKMAAMENTWYFATTFSGTSTDTRESSVWLRISSDEG